MPNWRHCISIKSEMSDREDVHEISRLSKILAYQLRKVLNLEEKWIEVEHKMALDEYFIYEFEDVVTNFEWLADICLTDDDPEEYSFDNWLEAFNSYLDCLYDIGDTLVSRGISWSEDEKFIWVS